MAFPDEKAEERIDSQATEAGARNAQLFARLLDELTKIAAAIKQGESPSLTLSSGDLISEAMLRISDDRLSFVENDEHFKRIAARAMRRVLVEHCRRKRRRQKRFQAFCRTPRDEDTMDVLAVHDGLQALSRVNEQSAEIVEMRYFGEMTTEEIARALDVHATSVRRHLRSGIAWLRRWWHDSDSDSEVSR